MSTAAQDAEKAAVAAAAVAQIPQGIRLGLGSGSTLEKLVPLLAARVRAGLDVRCVPTSTRIASLAREHGLTLEDLGAEPLALAVDGADEVDPRLQLVKGAGGALVRERIVASAASRFMVLVDSSKLVGRLGQRMPLPVEIQQFGAERTRQEVARKLGDAVLRVGAQGPVVSDNGGFLLDCRLSATGDLPGLASALRAIPGVVDTGLFLDFRPEVLVARDGKVEMISPG